MGQRIRIKLKSYDYNLVDKSAQKTDGYQRNDTLMLSNESRSDSIPGLEIEADDVRASFGRVGDEPYMLDHAGPLDVHNS